MRQYFKDELLVEQTAYRIEQLHLNVEAVSAGNDNRKILSNSLKLMIETKVAVKDREALLHIMAHISNNTDAWIEECLEKQALYAIAFNAVGNQ